MNDSPATAHGLLAEIQDVGVDKKRGGYSRPAYSTAEQDLRSWFVDHAERLGLDVTVDRNGIIWAWLDVASGDRTNAVVTGSHLDSVPGGGAFDGPLGVASALVAADTLRHRSDLTRPLAVAVFPEEEGSRFGVACLGSRLLTGAIDADRARNLKDRDGVTFAEACRSAGVAPEHLGRDDATLAQMGCFIELHIEQGRDLVQLDRPVAIGTSILGHGRWQLTVKGQGNHAGTTLMHDRQDPMVVAAQAVTAVRQLAQHVPDARATVGRIEPLPGGTNVIASRVDLWLDVRHPLDSVTAALVQQIHEAATNAGQAEGCSVELIQESLSPTVHFSNKVIDQLSGLLPQAPTLPTGAGHDAGVLSPLVPTGMLFVRNPTGVSHSPEEHIEDVDGEAGAAALTKVLTALATQG